MIVIVTTELNATGPLTLLKPHRARATTGTTLTRNSDRGGGGGGGGGVARGDGGVRWWRRRADARWQRRRDGAAADHHHTAQQSRRRVFLTSMLLGRAYGGGSERRGRWWPRARRFGLSGGGCGGAQCQRRRRWRRVIHPPTRVAAVHTRARCVTSHVRLANGAGRGQGGTHAQRCARALYSCALSRGEPAARARGRGTRVSRLFVAVRSLEGQTYNPRAGAR